jgi:protein tyrosine/serine phosphatase
LFKGISEACYAVVNLKIGTRYFWKVMARYRDTLLAESAVWVFTTNPLAPRWLHVPGITNVRDMGGWVLPGNKRVRQGLIYRSSEMNGHVEITEEGRRVLIDDLKIRTDIDLRGSGEDPKAVLDQTQVTWINLPIGPYKSIIEKESRENYRRIFKMFADSSHYPILFHCWGGCDRGGTVAFLLHAILGLDKNSLFRDYELSSLSIWGERSCSSDLFQSLLNALQPFGDGKDDFGIQGENYLLSIGITAAEIGSIRTLLIDDTGSV